MKTITAAYGQSIEDICLQEYGSLEGLSLLLADNELGMDSLLYAGQPIVIQDDANAVSDSAKAVRQYLRDNALLPNAGFPGEAPDTAYVEDDYWDDDYSE